MKICLIGDMHIGIRNGSDIFDNYFRKCCEEFVFPLLDTYSIKMIFQLGDLYHDRKAVSTKSIKESKEYFFDKLRSRNIEMLTLVGNHDAFYKDSLSVYSHKEFLSEYENIRIINTPQEISIGGKKFACLPWICKENYEQSLNLIKNSDADILIGHLEVAGFSMYKGMKAKEGMSPKLFEKYHRVWSGHYHTKSSEANIQYLGTPYELTWQDSEDPRGIYIYDTATDELEFFQNPFELFKKIRYTAEATYDVKNYENTFVKIYVVNKGDQVSFDKFVDSLYNAGAYNVEIFEDLTEFKETAEIDEQVDIKDTLSIIRSYVDSIDTDKDKEEIVSYLQELYTEALNTEWQ